MGITPAQVRAASAADGYLPGIPREPGELRCLGAQKGASGSAAKTAYLEDMAVRIAEDVAVGAVNHGPGATFGHLMAALAAKQQIAARIIGFNRRVFRIFAGRFVRIAVFPFSRSAVTRLFAQNNLRRWRR